MNWIRIGAFVCSVAAPLWAQAASVVEAAALVAPNAAGVDDVFGLAVSVDADTIVVGSPATPGVAAAAYVFERPNSGWSTIQPVAVLTASNGALGDRFGRAVAVRGDTIVVTAPGTIVGGAARRGAAYVFERPADGWQDLTESAVLLSSDGAFGDEFGSAVALDGDTIVVGAARVDVAGNTDRGAAYAFVRKGGAWRDASEDAKFVASNGVARDGMGFSVAIHRDTIVVGASGEDLGGPSRIGAAYVYERSRSGWRTGFEDATLTSSDGVIGDIFGVSVSIEDDVVVVGADDAGIAGTPDQGAAYVFIRPPDGWSDSQEVAKLTASDGRTGDAFGVSVSLDGDVVAIGAHSVDIAGAKTQGAIYLYRRPLTGWATAQESAKLVTSDGAARDFFGLAVSMDGGLVVGGAPRRGRPGRVWLFDAPAWSRGSGCGGDLGVSGSRRLGGTVRLVLQPGSSPGMTGFLVGSPRPIPWSLPSGVPCGGRRCSVACRPVLDIPGPTGSVSLPVDPAAIGHVLCVQGLSQGPSGCVKLTEAGLLTVSR